MKSRFVLRRIADLQTGSIGRVIFREGAWPLKINHCSRLYSLVEGRATRLRDLKRRHVKRGLKLD